MKILRLIRIENLALLAFVQLIFRYGFLEQQPGLPLALSHWQYALLILASVLIAAGGSLMESISGPGKYAAGVSEAQGYNIYLVLNALGIGIGYYLSSYIDKPFFTGIFVVIASMLYFAVTNFRQTLLGGNILISLSAAMSIIIVGIYNFFPFLVLDNKEYFSTMFQLLLDYSIFAFIIVLLYTIIIDLRNTDEDYNSGKSTLPILLGRDRTVKAVFGFALIPALLLLYYINTYLYNLMWALGYVLIFMLGPLIYFLIKILSAKTAAQFRHLGIIIKLVMVFATLSVLVITFNIIENA